MAAGKLLALLASPKNQRILNFLATEPAHTKAIAQSLDMSDSEVSRSLRALEGTGLLTSRWTRLGPHGKEMNVKEYRLNVRGLGLSFGPEGMGVRLESESPRAKLLVPAYHFQPPESALFVGRNALVERAGAEARVLILEGLPGIGKTSLAAAIARGSGRQVLWHSVTPTDTARRLLNKVAVFLSGWGDDRLLEALRAGTEDEEVLGDLVLGGFDRDDFLLALDNYHEIVDEAAIRAVHRLLAKVTRARIVLTTRRQPRFIPPEQAVEVIHLEGLSEDDTAAFLTKKELTIEGELLGRVHRRFGGHPLFLNFFAEAVKAGRKTVADFFDEVPEEELERYLWDELWSGLDERERAILVNASVFPEPFRREALEAVLPDQRLPQTLFTLERKLLLARSGPWYDMHEVVRAFAYDKLADRKGAHGRAARFFEGEGSTEGRLHAMAHWHRAGQRKDVVRLLEDDVDLPKLDILGDGLHLLYQEVLDSFEASELPPRLWLNVLDDRADILLVRGNAAGAIEIYREVVRRAVEGGFASTAADALWKTSLASFDLADPAAAKAAIEEGLRICPEEDPETRERLETARKRLPAKRS